MSLLKLEEETLNRSRYFQDVQIWPINNKLNYEGWLSNFKTDEEKRIGNTLLNSFIYYSDNMINELMKKCLILSSCFIKSQLIEWDIKDIYTKAIFSYMPGEDNHFTDSGIFFARKLKKVFRIPEERILSPQQLFEQFESINDDSPIIFVDDFVGTGAQTKKAWNNYTYSGINFAELLQKRISIYCPLICNHLGYNEILKECTGLKLICNHILGEEYNLQKENCPCWDGDKDLFKLGNDFLTAKGKELGIYSYCANTVDVFGYCCQGLSIAFEHGTPDATCAIYTYKSDNWKPLIIY